MIEQTRFFSTVFLCTAFKLENIYLGVNLCGNFISGNSVYRYLKQIEGEIVACVQTPAPLEFPLRGCLSTLSPLEFP